MHAAPEARHRLNDVLAILLVWGVVAAVGLGERHLWDPLEGRYAGIALEMAEGGHWLVPRYQDASYDQKPPLGFWLAAAGLEVFGAKSRLALRLPSALALLVAMFGLRAIGERLHGRRAGLLAALVLGTAWLPFWSARFFLLDTLVLAGLVLFVDGALRLAKASRRGRLGGVLLVSLGTGVGLLSKGPLVPLFGLAILLPLSATGHFPLRRAGSGTFLGLLVGTALAAAWYLPARQAAGPAWGDALLFGEGFGRHVAMEDDRHGPFYYFRAIWMVAMPWSLWLPVALWALLRRHGGWRDHAVGLSWLVAVFAILFLGPVQRDRYLMPVLPAVALLLGSWLARVGTPGETATTRAERRWVRWLSCVLPLLAAVVATPLLLLPQEIGSLLEPSERLARGLAWLGDHRVRRLVFCALFLLLAGCAIHAFRRRHQGRALGVAFATVALVGAGWGLVAAPAADAGREDDMLTAWLDEELRPEDRLLILGGYAFRESTWGWFRFYCGRAPIGVRVPPEDLETLRGKRPTLLVTREKVIRREPRLLEAGWEPLTSGPIHRDDFRMFRLAPRDASASSER